MPPGLVRGGMGRRRQQGHHSGLVHGGWGGGEDQAELSLSQLQQKGLEELSEFPHWISVEGERGRGHLAKLLLRVQFFTF